MLRIAAFSIVLALLIGATLSIKFGVAVASQVVDEARLYADIAQVLHRQGYQTRLQPMRNFSPLLIADAGGCRLVMRRSWAVAGMMQNHANRLAPYGSLRIIYDGTFQTKMPGLRAQIGDYAQRSLAQIGLSVSARPILAYAANPQCQFDPVTLAGLRQYYHSALPTP